eukprot:TRINITY_DN47922_c0_g1_i1.p1 TRINITY_DN47922_c0_g1~~TRINITY_DN47922_c0_g1_i1.p1  ORF type:complete len:585 (+),score=104.75 TRINITY_DN47922_c0_g1_i1:78-1832(+)
MTSHQEQPNKVSEDFLDITVPAEASCNPNSESSKLVAEGEDKSPSDPKAIVIDAKGGGYAPVDQVKEIIGEDTREAAPILLASLCAVGALEGADMALLPAVFYALQEDLGLEITSLATMSLIQGVTGSVVSPFWGIMADRGIMQRKTIIISGCILQGLVTMILACVDDFILMTLLRALNGVFLASLRPIANGVIADVTSETRRGKVFGFVQLSTSVGLMLGGLIGTPMSTISILGIQGWRVAFVLIGGLSIAVGAFTALTMKEPPRETSSGLDSKARGAFSEEAMKLLSYFRMPTFCALIFQGWFGGVPWNAMAYTTLFYQVGGLSSEAAATLTAAGTAAGAAGGLLGGMIGDRLSKAFPNHGRPLTAQISVMAGIPVAYMTFMVHPPSDQTAAYIYYLSLVLFMGLTATWCGVGVNLPILTEIVRPEGRATILAWEAALESTFATILGNSMVGFLAASFGYKLQSGMKADHVADEESRAALGKALTLTCFVPWIICWFAYSLLHWSYPRDLRSARLDRQKTAEEQQRRTKKLEGFEKDETPEVDSSKDDKVLEEVLVKDSPTSPQIDESVAVTENCESTSVSI